MSKIIFFDGLSYDEAQKYNGKNVEIQNLLDVFFHNENLILFFKTPSMTTVQQFKLRLLLNSKNIKLKKIKKKNLLVGFKFSQRMLKNVLISELKELFNLSGFFLIFDDFIHFSYFENSLAVKLFKNQIIPIYFKLNNQYFLINSESYLFLKNKLSIYKNQFKIIRGFFLFAWRFSLCLFFFILHFRVQTIFLNLL